MLVFVPLLEWNDDIPVCSTFLISELSLSLIFILQVISWSVSEKHFMKPDPH